MPNYTKLFNSIVTSTIWTEDDKTRIVWITMLALADQNGEVHGSIPGLARLAGVTTEACENAINKFLSPDKYSRTPDSEGRRIAEIEGGWELLNHAKYRNMASLADRKDATAKRQQRFRERNAPVTHCNASGVTSNAPVTLLPDKAEAEAEAEAYLEKEAKASMSVNGRADGAFLAEIWSIFPAISRNRSSKKQFTDAWRKTHPKPSEAEVIESARKWSACPDCTKDGGQFAPAAHLFFKNRRWESEPEQPDSKPAKQQTFAGTYEDIPL